MSTAAQVIDEAIEQLLRGVAEESSGRRTAEERAAEAEEQLTQMQADCAEAIEQCCTLAEDRIAADRRGLAAEPATDGRGGADRNHGGGAGGVT